MRQDWSNPDSIAGSSEHSQQAALLSAVAQLLVNSQDSNVLALHWLYAIPNGGDRNRVVAANMKAEGVKRGVADLCMPVARRGYHSFYIEMKRPGNLSGQSTEQKDFADFVRGEGSLYAVFDNWRDAFHALCWYLNIEQNRF